MNYVLYIQILFNCHHKSMRHYYYYFHFLDKETGSFVSWVNFLILIILIVTNRTKLYILYPDTLSLEFPLSLSNTQYNLVESLHLCLRKTSENLFLHKKKKLGNRVKLNSFRILEICQRIVTIGRVFIQGKWLNLMLVNFVIVYLVLFSFLLPSSVKYRKTNCIIIKTSVKSTA